MRGCRDMTKLVLNSLWYFFIKESMLFSVFLRRTSRYARVTRFSCLKRPIRLTLYLSALIL